MEDFLTFMLKWDEHLKEHQYEFFTELRDGSTPMELKPTITWVGTTPFFRAKVVTKDDTPLIEVYRKTGNLNPTKIQASTVPPQIWAKLILKPKYFWASTRTGQWGTTWTADQLLVIDSDAPAPSNLADFDDLMEEEESENETF